MRKFVTGKRQVFHWSPKMKQLWMDIQVERAYKLGRRGIRGSLSPRAMRKRCNRLKRAA